MTLSALDWAVIAAYVSVLVVTGVLFNRKGASDTGEYFLGGRRMPVWAVAISVVATALSAATFVGGPQQAFAGNLTYLAPSQVRRPPLSSARRCSFLRRNSSSSAASAQSTQRAVRTSTGS